MVAQLTQNQVAVGICNEEMWLKTVHKIIMSHNAYKDEVIEKKGMVQCKLWNFFPYQMKLLKCSLKTLSLSEMVHTDVLTH